jgi:DNA-binding MarR family transcriptional regulator
VKFITFAVTKNQNVMEEKVLKALAAGPKKAGDIATETGIAKADVDKIIKKLVAAGRVDSPKRCFYGIKA